MIVQTIPLKVATHSRSIDSIEREEMTSKRELDRGFNQIVTACIHDIKKQGWCYCLTRDEIQEIRRKLGQITVKNVIIEGESYDMWEVRK